MSAIPELDTLILESALEFAIFAMDFTGTIVRWSRGAVRVLGWSEDEAVGQPGHIIFTHEDRLEGIPDGEIATSRLKGRSLDERWHLRKDQTRFWASGEMMVLRSADGDPIGLMKIIRDRTERWLTEQKQLTLAKLGEGLANMVQPGEMATLAAQLVRTTLNAAGAGYATIAEELQIEGSALAPHTMLTDQDLISVSRGAIERRVAPLGDGALTATSVSVGQSSAGAYCVVPLFESHRPVALFSVLNDGERLWTSDEIDFIREIAIRSRFAIERRRAEETLRQLAADLERQVERRLVERNRLWANTRDLMAIVDSNATIREANPAWKEILGWDISDLHGRTLYEFTDEAGGRALQEALVAEGARPQFQVNLTSSEQKTRQFVWSLYRDADVAYLVGRDVTEQLEIEARLRQSQKMEAIGQLTGGIAHDFNNLLAGIIGSLDLLRLRIANNRPEDIERHMQAARTAAHRAAALTHRLLAFSRQQPLDRKPVDMNRLVAEMEELLRRTLHVRIELELKLNASKLVLSDAHQMENAVLNLVINARDAMSRGGKIVISTYDCENEGPIRATIASGRHANYGCLSVTDNGEGIPPEVVTKVFEPFFTTKPAGQGTGLGLAMIYQFVNQMGGDVDLQTEVGKGTVVRMYFPCSEPHEPGGAHVVSTQYPRGQGERVLVVEDDARVRSTIVEMLRELGYVAEQAEGPESALQILRSVTPIDLLITDWGLPGLDGGELATLARDGRAELPICFVTGYTAGDDEIGALRPNETRLTKPVGIELLAQTVAQMLRRT